MAKQANQREQEDQEAERPPVESPYLGDEMAELTDQDLQAEQEMEEATPSSSEKPPISPETPEVSRLRAELLEKQRELLSLQAARLTEAKPVEPPEERPPSIERLDILQDVDDQTLEGQGIRGALNLMGERLIKVATHAIAKAKKASDEDAKRLRDELDGLRNYVSRVGGEVVEAQATAKYQDWKALKPEIEKMVKENPERAKLGLDDCVLLARARLQVANPTQGTPQATRGAGQTARPKPSALGGGQKPTSIGGEEEPEDYDTIEEAAAAADREERTKLKAMEGSLAARLGQRG